MDKLIKLYLWAKNITFELDEVFFFIITLLFLLCVVGCDIKTYSEIFDNKAKYSFTLSGVTVINATCDKFDGNSQKIFFNCVTDEIPPNKFNIINPVNVLEFQ
jgi:hypothetical protein